GERGWPEPASCSRSRAEEPSVAETVARFRRVASGTFRHALQPGERVDGFAKGRTCRPSPKLDQCRKPAERLARRLPYRTAELLADAVPPPMEIFRIGGIVRIEVEEIFGERLGAREVVDIDEGAGARREFLDVRSAAIDGDGAGDKRLEELLRHVIGCDGI